VKEPHDATQDVKSSFRDVFEEIRKLRAQYSILPGTRITGAQDANTSTGLVTLQQLNSYYAGLQASIDSKLTAAIEKLKTDNGLI